MRQPVLTGHRLAAAFLFGLVLFCSPLPALFHLPVSWAGIPLIYLYLFGSWTALIAILAWILRGQDE